MRSHARLVFAVATVFLSISGLPAQNLRYWVFVNQDIVPAFDSGLVPCGGAGCGGAFAANGNDGLTITGSVLGQGIPNGRRLRVFGVTATKAGGDLAPGIIDVVACYYLAPFTVVAPNLFNTLLVGTFSNAVGDHTIHTAAINFNPDRNVCDSRPGPYLDNFNRNEFTPAPPAVDWPFVQTHSYGLFQEPVTGLGATVRLRVGRSGDTVNIATTSADVEATTVVPIVPVLPVSGIILMVIALMGAGAWLLVKHHPHL